MDSGRAILYCCGVYLPTLDWPSELCARILPVQWLGERNETKVVQEFLKNFGRVCILCPNNQHV